jgi:hypothetical protein
VPTRAVRQPPEKQTDKAGRQQLERILASATFRQVDRLKRFLAFIVEEALQGHGDQLKEYVIGVQVFDKDTGFDPRADPIVRVQARPSSARTPSPSCRFRITARTTTSATSARASSRR